MAEPILTADGGKGGKVELYEDRVVLKRDGVMQTVRHGLKGDKEIRLEKISGVQLKEPGMVTAGYIQFSHMGSDESPSGIMDATQDENSIMINHGEFDQFEKLKEKLYELQNEGSKGTEDTTSDEDPAIQKLREKFASGEISEEEYNRRLDVLRD